MGINGENFCFGTRIVREVFRINETMQDSYLSPVPASASTQSVPSALRLAPPSSRAYSLPG